MTEPRSALEAAQELHRIADHGYSIAIEDRLFLREFAAHYLAVAEENRRLKTVCQEVVDASTADGPGVDTVRFLVSLRDIAIRARAALEPSNV